MTEGKATPLTRDQWLAECGKLARIYEEHMSMAMDEIEKKALALVNEIEQQEGLSDLTPRIMRGLIMDEAICRAIEAHEAFRQEVSDYLTRYYEGAIPALLRRFIIPAPVDPLVEAVREADAEKRKTVEDWTNHLRAALAARGLEIRKVGE